MVLVFRLTKFGMWIWRDFAEALMEFEISRVLILGRNDFGLMNGGGKEETKCLGVRFTWFQKFEKRGKMQPPFLKFAPTNTNDDTEIEIKKKENWIGLLLL